MWFESELRSEDELLRLYQGLGAFYQLLLQRRVLFPKLFLWSFSQSVSTPQHSHGEDNFCVPNGSRVFGQCLAMPGIELI